MIPTNSFLRGWELQYTSHLKLYNINFILILLTFGPWDAFSTTLLLFSTHSKMQLFKLYLISSLKKILSLSKEIMEVIWSTLSVLCSLKVQKQGQVYLMLTFPSKIGTILLQQTKCMFLISKNYWWWSLI